MTSSTLRAPIERATANDMMQLAVEVGSVPMQVGALLELDVGPALDVERAGDLLARRIQAIPRLRQRLEATAFGCGRPIWVDDASFDIHHHLHVRLCPSPGDEAALLACATEILGTRLPRERPPWSATFVTGVEPDRTALVIVFNHVLADGIGGLAVLAALVDGMPDPIDYGFPRPAPSRRAVAVEATSSRLRALRHWRRGLAIVRAAMAELKPNMRSVAPRTSLNRSTGSRRATGIVHGDLDTIRASAHAHGATVNDVVLAVVTGGLRELLLARGEQVDRFVVSIPISARRGATTHQLGNAVGVLPVDLPALGPYDDRLTAIARITRERKQSDGERGASAAVVGPFFRVLARLGVLRRFIDHQHLINTLVTNLRGPDAQLSFAGAAVTEVIPISIVTGNVTVAFAVLSYAGSLTITVNSDADLCPDLALLVKLLQSALDEAALLHEGA
jgi:diacylglycerol O-acyltransferase / wax synthase